MRSVKAWYLGVLILCSGAGGASGSQVADIRIKGSWSGVRYQEDLARVFESNTPGVTISVKGMSQGTSHDAGVKTFCAGEADILIYSGPLSANSRRLMTSTFCQKRTKTDETEDERRQRLKGMPRAFPLGRFAVFAVVHKSNPVMQLSYKQIHGILRRQPLTWDQLGGDKLPVAVHGTRETSKGYEILKNECMGIWLFRRDIQRHRDDSGVISAVAKDKAAFGYFLHRQRPVKDAKLVSIAKADKGPFYAPTPENIFEGKYPLMEDLTLYLHPKAPPQATAYCEFAVGPEGAKIAKKWYLYPEYERQQYFARKRLAHMKAGKGVVIRGVGSAGGAGVLRDLAVEYVKAKEVVQMACMPAASDLTAVGYFVHGKDRELLVLDAPLSEQAKKIHGKKWESLNPETHVLASGRGIAICVNSMNKLRSLTLEQVRHLFSKKTTTWREVIGADVKIKRYGLVGTDPAAPVFYNCINPPAACARAETKQGTQAVLAALSRDPHGIAFVDAGAANDLLGAAPGKSGIKVLSIGAKGKAATPTAANVKAGKYPISQRLTLHVSPRASQTTRDFVKFILSGAADEVFTKHGLITPAQARKAATKK